LPGGIKTRYTLEGLPVLPGNGAYLCGDIKQGFLYPARTGNALARNE